MNLLLKHELVLRTYSKKPLIMASIFGSKSKSFITMLIPPQDEPLISRDFSKPVKETSLPQDVPSTSDRHLIELENQVQRSMEAYLDPRLSAQVNKIASSCEICSGPYDTIYCMESPDQAFVNYASSRTNEAGGKWFTLKPEQNKFGDTYNPSWKNHPNLRLSKFEADFKQQQGKMTNKIDTVLEAINDRITRSLPSDMIKNPKPNVNSTSPVLSTRFTQQKTLDAHPKSTVRSTLSQYVPRNRLNLIMTNLKVMTQLRRNARCQKKRERKRRYNWIIKKQLEPRKDPEGIRAISNFTRIIKGMHMIVGNFTYVLDFMIVEDISSIIDPRLSQVVLEKPFVKISNKTHDLSL
nr:MAK10-like protein [Tanacetum cinerariifolium]